MFTKKDLALQAVALVLRKIRWLWVQQIWGREESRSVGPRAGVAVWSNAKKMNRKNQRQLAVQDQLCCQMKRGEEDSMAACEMYSGSYRLKRHSVEKTEVMSGAGPYL